MRKMNDAQVRYDWLLLFCLLYILVLTWMPFEFSAFNFHRRFQIGVAHWQDVVLTFRSWDTLNNILLFIPLGFILRGLGVGLFKRPALKAAGIILSGFTFSVLIECGQFFLDRTPSLFDLASNTIGTAFGLIAHDCYIKARRSPRIRPNHRILRPLVIGMTIVYGLILAIIQFYPLKLNSLSEWNPDYPLIVGDEATKDRPWQGDIALIAVYDQALSARRVRMLASEGFLGIRELRPDAIALYDFSETKGDTVYDRSQFENPIDLVGKNIRRIQESHCVRFGPALTGQRNIQRLTQSIQQSGQFSVEVWMRSANGTQSGPARIVSVSKNPDRRNWTLGQERSDLIFRVRTHFAGPNGSWIILKAKSSIDSVLTRHLVFTFQHGLERIYLDGSARPEIIHADLFYLPFILRVPNNPMSQAGCMFVLWFPFGILLTVVIGNGRRWVAWFSSVIWAGAIELVFITAIGQPFHSIFILYASVFAGLGIWAAHHGFGSLDSGRSEAV
jgi:glycopeptide antibiotics resistance protein